MASRQNSFTLLRSRYLKCLRDIPTVSDVLSALVTEGVISQEDRNAVLRCPDIESRRCKLAEAMAAQGSGKLTTTLSLIDRFNEEVPLSPKGQPSAEVPARRTWEFEGTENSTSWKVGNEGFPSQRHSPSEVPSGPHPTTVSEVIRVPGRKARSSQMESFIILLYTFLSQTAQAIQHATSSRLNWIQLDLTVDKIREYFPRHLIQGVRPSHSSPAEIRLSLLLEAFYQFYHKYLHLVEENKALSSRVLLLEDMTKRVSVLEGEVVVWKRKAEAGTGQLVQLPHLPSPSTQPCNCKTENDQKTQGLESKVYQQRKEIAQLRIALSRSEDRNKQLVGVTQIWADESADKDKLIRLLEIEIKELKSTKEQLKKKVAKGRRQLEAEKGRGEREQSPHPSEGAREELVQIQERCDRAVAEREETMDQVKLLLEEKKILILQIEELRDANEEVKDKLGNWQVQAHAKEPSVREMSLLAQENRQMKLEIEQLQKTVSELSDEVLAYRTHMEDLQEAARDDLREEETQRRARHVQPPVHQPAKTQTLVTGYRSPLRRVQPRTPPYTDEATPHSYLNRHPPRGGGSQIGVDSGEQPEHSSPPSPSHHPQLSATSMDLARPKSAPNRRGRSRTPSPTALVPDSHCPDAPSSMDGDYTQRIRYPNNSGILVEPLVDGDLAVLQSLVEEEGKGKTPPRYVDQTLLLPVPADLEKAGGTAQGRGQEEKINGTVETQGAWAPTPPLSPNQPVAFLNGGYQLTPRLNEQTCPHCTKTFLTLGTVEFEAHVATCSSYRVHNN